MDRFIITNGNKYICYHYDSGRHIVSVSSWERNDRSNGPIEEKEIPCGSYYEFFRMTEEIKTTSDIVIERNLALPSSTALCDIPERHALRLSDGIERGFTIIHGCPDLTDENGKRTIHTIGDLFNDMKPADVNLY